MAYDPFESETREPAESAIDAFAVTPSDSANFATVARALYVGGAGNVTLITRGGNTVLFSAIPVGTILPVACTRVNATSTTATLIVGLV